MKNGKGNLLDQSSGIKISLDTPSIRTVLKRMPELLASLLKKARNSKKVTLRAVEKATGISNAYLSQLENGKIKQPSPQFLSKLSSFYSIDYQRVMELAGYAFPFTGKAGEEIKAISLFNGEKLSNEEELKLIEYLAFLRTRK